MPFWRRRNRGPVTIRVDNIQEIMHMLDQATALVEKLTRAVNLASNADTVTALKQQLAEAQTKASKHESDMNATVALLQGLFDTIKPAAPTIDSFSADPASAEAGQSTTLYADVQGHVDSVSLADGTAFTNAQGGTIWSLQLSHPTAETVAYTVTAAGLGGEATAQATIVWTPASS